MSLGTHIVLLVLGEKLKEFLQESNELLGHGIQFVDVIIGIDITKASADRVVDEEEVCELVPGAIVQCQRVVVQDAIGAYLHQGAVL